ncbi:MAG: winged helix-turn-helix domain-containing protein [Anaerolineaceae bacterium]|nr:winged helix-turn-helix domain-containing protein [Anaerolineaceae bacterium]
MEAKEAFASLKQIANKELGKAQQEGASYFTNGDTTRVRETADRVEKIQAVLSTVHQLQDQWAQVIPDSVPVTNPQPINNNQRTPRGQRTHEERFWLPIMKVLSEMGGKGQAGLVLDRVEELMADILNEVDCHNLPSGRCVRWRNTAMWARLKMVHAGLLSSHSPNGVWEITEEGQKYLENKRTIN